MASRGAGLPLVSLEIHVREEFENRHVYPKLSNEHFTGFTSGEPIFVLFEIFGVSSSLEILQAIDPPTRATDPTAGLIPVTSGFFGGCSSWAAATVS